jgi:hypothetical protein
MLILTFEMVPGELYQEYIWKWTEEEDLNSKQQAVGLDSRIFMLSMGFPFYVFLISIILFIVALTMACVIYAQNRCVDKPLEVEGG